MTSPTSTGLGLSKCVGCESSKSAVKCSRYLCMGAPVVTNEVLQHPFCSGVGHPPLLNPVSEEARDAA